MIPTSEPLPRSQCLGTSVRRYIVSAAEATYNAKTSKKKS